ncbi:hypothetical protein F5Y05DRAFT_369375 [Hypoxylon sp. FL0543]|nr:hypothetical protein F5Y05DRAFT_369375 [Hypoxylon sp. FL0543]
MSPTTRHQARSAARGKLPSAIREPSTSNKTHASGAGTSPRWKEVELGTAEYLDNRLSATKQKTISKTKSKHGERGKRATKGAQAKATKALENRVSAMEAEVAWLEQRELLGIAGEPNHITPKPSMASPKAPKSKRGRKKKKPAEEMYMDDFLLSDEEGEAGEGLGKEGERGLRREDRWIPDIEHRGRPARKPKNVPYQIWMSYTLLDDYIYRQSLTDEEALTHPLMDDVYLFQNGGPQPVTPAGFQWNDRRRLVPVKENAA